MRATTSPLTKGASLLSILVIAFILGRFSQEATETASAQAACATENGDVNGDGMRDIGDPVYMLSWLFSGGPEPEPICSQPTAIGLPDTGQTICYDQSGAVVDCTTGACFGQDGFYNAGCPPVGRFVDNGDGTVTDTCTGLMWQQGTGNGGMPLDWCAALDYCENLSLGTNPTGGQYDNWRLPNIRELQSIVDYGLSGAAIDPVFGDSSSSPNYYWSSTSIVDNPSFAWIVCFNVGIVGGSTQGGKNGSLFVRAVRSLP